MYEISSLTDYRDQSSRFTFEELRENMIKLFHRKNPSQNLRDGERPRNKPVLASVFCHNNIYKKMARMNLQSRLRYYHLKFVRNALNRCTNGRRGSQLDPRFDNIYEPRSGGEKSRDISGLNRGGHTQANMKSGIREYSITR